MQNPIILFRAFLITPGTQNLSDIQVNHPSRTYAAKVLRWGGVDRSIPVPSGLIQVGDAEIELDDTDGSFQGWFNTVSPMRCGAELKLGETGQSESTQFLPIFEAEIAKCRFPLGKAIIKLKDITTAWLDDKIPKLGTKDNFPNQPVGQAEFFWPLIFGRLESPAVDSPVTAPQGQVEFPPVDMAANRYGVARHEVYDVLAVFRQRPGDDVFIEVDIAEYNIVTESQAIDGITYTFTYVEFLTGQEEGTKVRGDVSGVDFRGGFGAMAPVSGELRNPVDHIINLVYYLLLKETRISRFNVASYTSVRALCVTNNIYSDGAIVSEITPREALSQICGSSEIDFFVNKSGEISLALTLDDGAVSLPTISDGADLLDVSVETPPDEVYNRLHYKFGRNYATGEWNNEYVLDNETDQLETSPATIKETTIELPFVRSEATALLVISNKARFFTLHSDPIEAVIPIARIADVELAAWLSFTFATTLGISRRYKTTGVNLDLDQLKITVHGRRAPLVADLVLTSSWEGSHPSGYPAQTPPALTAPDGVEAFGRQDIGVYVKWNAYVNEELRIFKRFNVYRATVNDFALAVEVAQGPNNWYNDPSVVDNPAQTYYYWIRGVSKFENKPIGGVIQNGLSPVSAVAFDNPGLDQGLPDAPEINVLNDVGFVDGNFHFIVGVDKIDGLGLIERWHDEVTAGSIYSTPVVIPDFIRSGVSQGPCVAYVSYEDRKCLVRKIDDGTLVLTKTTGNSNYGRPAAAILQGETNHTVFFPSHDGKIYAQNAVTPTGSDRWTVSNLYVREGGYGTSGLTPVTAGGSTNIVTVTGKSWHADAFIRNRSVSGTNASVRIISGLGAGATKYEIKQVYPSDHSKLELWSATFPAVDSTSRIEIVPYSEVLAENSDLFWQHAGTLCVEGGVDYLVACGFDGTVTKIRCSDGVVMAYFCALENNEAWPEVVDVGFGHLSVLFASIDEKFRCLALSDLSLEWSYTSTAPLDAVSFVARVDGVTLQVVVNGRNNRTTYLRASDGTALYQSADMAGDLDSGPCLILQGDGSYKVFVVGDAGLPTLLDKYAGTVWQDSRGTIFNSTPQTFDVDGDGHAEIVCCDMVGNILAYDQNGNLLMSRAAQNGVEGIPWLGDALGNGNTQFIVPTIGPSPKGRLTVYDFRDPSLVNWDTVEQVQVQVARGTDNTFSSPVYDRTYDLTRPPFTFPYVVSAENFGTHYFRARVRNTFGWSAWSGTVTRETDYSVGTDTDIIPVADNVDITIAGAGNDLRGNEFQIDYDVPDINAASMWGYEIMIHDSSTLPTSDVDATNSSYAATGTTGTGVIEAGSNILTDLTKSFATDGSLIGRRVLIFSPRRPTSGAWGYEGAIHLATVQDSDTGTRLVFDIPMRLSGDAVQYMMLTAGGRYIQEKLLQNRVANDINQNPQNKSKHRQWRVSTNQLSAFYVWLDLASLWGHGKLYGPVSVTLSGNDSFNVVLSTVRMTIGAASVDASKVLKVVGTAEITGETTIARLGLNTSPHATDPLRISGISHLDAVEATTLETTSRVGLGTSPHASKTLKVSGDTILDNLEAAATQLSSLGVNTSPGGGYSLRVSGPTAMDDLNAAATEVSSLGVNTSPGGGYSLRVSGPSAMDAIEVSSISVAANPLSFITVAANAWGPGSPATTIHLLGY